ncbi:unnamed protein product [Spodoptera exigua]|uniref:Uncharacterized protein n=1 Tax=Spodoptera exigua TaxID=7107 RepID=A0A835LCY1_SPOEX|nr:hypothetical protein HW555_003800 [Spodoptera exigua]KAH9627970.1 hypothetical protein HF086_017945 [Spodoptera exigua]CAH0703499.1 unnamed protein product [Spodoptera exigua]
MATNVAVPPPPKAKKPYEEISAIFNGNEVKIRVPKSTSKPPKLTPSQLKLQQSCTCEDDESVCSETCGMVRDGDDQCPGHRLDFQVPDDICESLTHRTNLNSELVYSKHHGNDTMCNICNVTPKDAPKGVQAQKVLHPDKDVFILKIGKQTDEPNRTGNIEVELVTPRAPAKPQPKTHHCMQIQCEEEDMPCCLPCRMCRGGMIMPRKRKLKRPRCCPY